MAETSPIVEAEPEKSTSMADALSKAWDESEKASVETEKVEVSAEPEKAAEAEKPAEVTQTATPSTAQIEAAVEAGIRPPSSWSAAAKAKWAAIDNEIQKEIDKRETDFHKGIEEYKGYKQKWSGFEQAVTPYLARIQSFGIDPVQAAQQLMAADYRLATGTPQDKANYFRYLAQTYGVDLNGLTDEQAQIDPNLAALQQQVAALQGQLQQGVQQQEQAAQQEIQSELQVFQSDPKNIYFNDVRQHMAALLRQGVAKDLNDAYEQACYANPAVRNALAEQQRIADEKKRISEAQQKAANAKRAAFDVNGKGAVETGKTKKSLRDSLEEAYDQANG